MDRFIPAMTAAHQLASESATVLSPPSLDQLKDCQHNHGDDDNDKAEGVDGREEEPLLLILISFCSVAGQAGA